MTEKYKVLHLITRLCVGGAQKNTLLTVELLDKKKWDVMLAAGSVDRREGSMEGEIPHNVPFVKFSALQRELNPYRDIKAFFQLYSFMRTFHFDVVHTHVSKAGIIGRLAAKLAKVPVIVHTPHGHVFHSYYGFLKTSLFKMLEKSSARATDKIIALTEQEKIEHLELGIGTAQKFEVIESGIELEHFTSDQKSFPREAMREQWGLKPEHRVVGTVARLVPIKGHEFLIQAIPDIIKVHPQSRFLIVGDGERKEELRLLAEKLGVGSYVIMTGSQRDVQPFYPLMDVFVLPSLNEGMGRVILEAMSSGVPVVATAVGGILNLVKDGETGILFPPRDASLLAQAVCGILSDHEKAARLSENAKKHLDVFSAEIMVQKIEALYENLLREKAC